MAKTRKGGPIPPYGVAIQEAIKSGDAAVMAKVAIQAQEYLAHADQVKLELDKLKGRLTNIGSVEPYGVAIQKAIASGDPARMKQVASDAEAYLDNAETVKKALKQLKSEISKS